MHTNLFQPVGHRDEVIHVAVFQLHFAIGNRGGDHEGAAFDAVGDDAVLAADEFFDAFNPNLGCAVTFDPRAHFIEHLSAVGYFWLTRRTDEYGFAFGKRCSAHDIDGAKNGWPLRAAEIHPAAFQSSAHLANDVAAFGAEFCPEFLQTADMKIDRPIADRASAGDGNNLLSALGKQRSQDADAGAHGLDDVVAGLALGFGDDLDVQRPVQGRAVNDAGDRVAAIDHAAQLADELGHRDFYKGPEKQKALLSLLAASHPQQDYIDAITILQLDSKTPRTAFLEKAIDGGLKNAEGTQTYIDIVRKYGIKNKDRELLAIAAKNDDEDTQADAVRLVLESGGINAVKNILFGNDTAAAKGMAGLLARTGNDNAKNLLQQFITDTKVNSGLRIATVKQLATGRRGETALLELVKNKKLPEDLMTTATDIFSKTNRKDLREEAAKYLILTDQAGKLPPVSQMLAVKGNADSGALVFTTYCATCHQVNGKGIAFGRK